MVRRGGECCVVRVQMCASNFHHERNVGWIGMLAVDEGVLVC